MTITVPAQNLPQNIQLTRGQTSQAFKFPTKNADGTALDVSSGFTAKVRTVSNPSAFNESVVDDTTNLTYSSTGVTWTPVLTAFTRQAYKFVVLISSDSFTTDTRISSGVMSVLSGDSDTISQLG